jgi:hypothetical protein
VTDNIKGSGDNYHCWSEALKHWIKQNFNTKKFGVPSWRSLLAAVAKVDKLQFKDLASGHSVQGKQTFSATNCYHIVGNFRGVQFSRMASLLSFLFANVRHYAHYTLYYHAYFADQLSRIAACPQKLQKLDPSKIFRYTVYIDMYMYLYRILQRTPS